MSALYLLLMQSEIKLASIMIRGLFEHPLFIKMDNLDSLSKFEANVINVRRILALVGYDIYANNGKLRRNLYTLFAYIICVTFIVCFVYTLYVQRKSPTEFLKCACVFGPPAQGGLKFIILEVYKDEMNVLHQQIIQFYRDCPKGGNFMLAYWTKRIYYICMVFLCYYLFSAFVFACAPWTLYLVFNIKMLILPVYIPGIDADEDYGFMITNGYEVICTGIAVLALLGVDLIFGILSFSAVMHLELIVVKCDTLNDSIRKAAIIGITPAQLQRNRQQITSALRDTVKSTQRADLWVSFFLSSVLTITHTVFPLFHLHTYLYIDSLRMYLPFSKKYVCSLCTRQLFASDYV